MKEFEVGMRVHLLHETISKSYDFTGVAARGTIVAVNETVGAVLVRFDKAPIVDEALVKSHYKQISYVEELKSTFGIEIDIDDAPHFEEVSHPSETLEVI